MTSYTVLYRAADTALVKEAEIVKGPCEILSTFTLDHLTPAHVYQVKVAATTEVGRGVFSNWVNLTTSEEGMLEMME